MQVAKKTPMRKRKWLINPIFVYANDILKRVMDISEEMNRKDIIYNDKISKRIENVIAIIDDVKYLQPLLLALWNVESYKFSSMCNFASQINLFQTLIIKTIKGVDYNIESEYICVLNFDRIKTVAFLSNLSELHKYTHGKVCHMKNTLCDNSASLIIELIDSAFSHVIIANSKIPQNKSEYEKRKCHISEAIKNLDELNRPLISCFNVMNYSENTMQQWGNLIDTEIKLLKGLQKSDAERFSNLTN